MPIKLRRLHLWESPSLHPSVKKNYPVHVVFEDKEYDWWRIGDNGRLEVGWTIERPADVLAGQPVTLEYHIFYAVAANMFAKVQEEWYTDEAEDDRGSAALGRARDEEGDEPHVERKILPTRTRFESFNGTSGHPDSQPEELPENHADETEDESPNVVTTARQENVVDLNTGVNISGLHEQVHNQGGTATMLLAPVVDAGDNRRQDGLADTRLDLRATR